MTVIWTLKNLRNHFQSFIYCKLGKRRAKLFLQSNNWSCQKKHLLVVIAFERPKVLEILLYALSKFFPTYEILVCDNSRTKNLRDAIEGVASSFNIHYLGLPNNITRHPNRSHALALNWVSRNLLQNLSFEWVGFIDHDLIPLRRPALETRMDAALKQNIFCFGHINHGKANYWNLWSGYAFFHSSLIKQTKLNFLYDFSRGLDTGGMNWSLVYRRISDVDLAAVETRLIRVSLELGDTENFRIIDDAWIHLGSYGHKHNPIRDLLSEHLDEHLLKNENFLIQEKL
jgi:hypothetical protein